MWSTLWSKSHCTGKLLECKQGWVSLPHLLPPPGTWVQDSEALKGWELSWTHCYSGIGSVIPTFKSPEHSWNFIRSKAWEMRKRRTISFLTGRHTPWAWKEVQPSELFYLPHSEVFRSFSLIFELHYPQRPQLCSLYKHKSALDLCDHVSVWILRMSSAVCLSSEAY